MTAWRNANPSQQNARAVGPVAPAMAARIDTIMMKVLEAMEGLADDLQSRRRADSESAREDPLPLTQARRRLVHILRLPRICARASCRHGGSCRGEPLHCLGAALPLLPPDIVAALKLNGRKTRRSRARQPNADARVGIRS